MERGQESIRKAQEADEGAAAERSDFDRADKAVEAMKAQAPMPNAETDRIIENLRQSGPLPMRRRQREKQEALKRRAMLATEANKDGL